MSNGHYADIHDPVLQRRIVELLCPALRHDGAIYVDATLGLGGHARAILQACPQAHLIGIDRDTEALAVAQTRLAPFADRVTYVHAVYDELPAVLKDHGLTGVDSILLDLGLSSLQIDRLERGFSYSRDAPLDMRMDPSIGRTAAEVVNTYSVPELAGILRRFGEEKFADRIARAIVEARESEPFTRSARLVAVISDAIPAAARYSGGHPAKRTFQALRIEVNDELTALTSVLPEAIAALNLDARIAVLAYHSLEDRLVKQAFTAGATDRAPRDLPIVPVNLQPELALVTRGAERPDPQEVQRNPRAASARLRVAKRVRHPA